MVRLEAFAAILQYLLAVFVSCVLVRPLMPTPKHPAVTSIPDSTLGSGTQIQSHSSVGLYLQQHNSIWLAHAAQSPCGDNNNTVVRVKLVLAAALRIANIAGQCTTALYCLEQLRCTASDDTGSARRYARSSAPRHHG
jgi:hypothetical protein